MTGSMIKDNLKDVFQDSLDSIGLNESKYLNLPYNIRRKTISFDIYKEVSHFFDKNLKFTNKDIFDYSYGEIENHYKVLNACIALVCLGNREYVKPLLNYLDFPEPRWSIKIDYLLKNLLEKESIGYSIPTYGEKLKIQKEFINEFFYSRLRDFSSIVLDEKTSIDYAVYLEDFKSKRYSKKTYSILRHHEYFEDDIACMERYYSRSYEFLKVKKFEQFISWINHSELEKRIIFLDSCTSSIGDAIDDLNISKRPNFWISHLKKQKASPLTTVYVFHALNNKRSNRKLANKFVHEFISDSFNPRQVAAISDLFEWNFGKGSLSRITGFLEDYNTFNVETRRNLNQINPLITFYIKSHIVNIYHSEKESLNLISYKPNEISLFKVFLKKYKSNSLIFDSLSKLILPSLWTLIKLSLDIKSLYSLRTDFYKSHLNSDSRDLSSKYAKFFKTWVEQSTKFGVVENNHDIKSKVK